MVTAALTTKRQRHCTTKLRNGWASGNGAAAVAPHWQRLFLALPPLIINAVATVVAAVANATSVHGACVW